jgi:hypothetical protein
MKWSEAGTKQVHSEGCRKHVTTYTENTAIELRKTSPTTVRLFC